MTTICLVAMSAEPTDDVRLKAEQYIDECIDAMDERERPSYIRRRHAIDRVEAWTRKLLKALPRP